MSDIKNRIDKIKEQIIDTKIGREILGLTEYDEIVDDFEFLITTIESQNIQIESLKAITELAVKGLERISVTFERGEMVRLAYEHLHEIKEMQNGTT